MIQSRLWQPKSFVLEYDAFWKLVHMIHCPTDLLLSNLRSALELAKWTSHFFLVSLITIVNYQFTCPLRRKTPEFFRASSYFACVYSLVELVIGMEWRRIEICKWITEYDWHLPVEVVLEIWWEQDVSMMLDSIPQSMDQIKILKKSTFAFFFALKSIKSSSYSILVVVNEMNSNF